MIVTVDPRHARKRAMTLTLTGLRWNAICNAVSMRRLVRKPWPVIESAGEILAIRQRLNRGGLLGYDGHTTNPARARNSTAAARFT